MTGGTPAVDRPVRRICIAVDDFGLHAGVSQAAIHLAQQGHVQAIGCMVGAPAWHVWSPRLHELDPQAVDVGLHLDLTEFPLHAGMARPVSHWIARSLTRRIDRGAVRAEIRRQLDAFEDALGMPPRYVDGHQHVHQLPGVRDELIEELAARYEAHPPWLRSTQPIAGPGGGPKAWSIGRLGARGLVGAAERHRFGMNRHLLGVYDFRADPTRYRRLLATWLHDASDGDLLMCHPSLPHDGPDPILRARLIEFDLLSHPAFALWLRRAGIEALPMSAILAEHRRPA